MSGLPKVNVTLGNGQLGGVTPADDRCAGLVLSGVAVTDKIGLNDPKQIFSPDDLAAIGITEVDNPFAWKECNAFYKRAGNGRELWINLYAAATTLATVCDKAQAGNIVKTLLDAAEGRIRLLGINRKTPAGYTPTTTAKIDADVITAQSNLQSLLNDYAAAYKPSRAYLPALHWTGVSAALHNCRQDSANRVTLVLGSDYIDSDNFAQAAVGFALGREAEIPVQRNPGRVKDGAMLTEAWFTDGSTVKSKQNMLDTLHDYGYMFFRPHIGKNGYYFNDAPVSAPLTDDYAYRPYGRTIDKAMVIIVSTYTDELLDDFEVDDAGKIPAGIIKYFEQRIVNAISANMAGEISKFSVYIDPAQNVISTGKTKMKWKIVPRATNREIEGELSFDNPALN
jgi:hypothetical protein